MSNVMTRHYHMANKASTTNTTFCNDSRMMLALDWFPSQYCQSEQSVNIDSKAKYYF